MPATVISCLWQLSFSIVKRLEEGASGRRHAHVRFDLASRRFVRVFSNCSGRTALQTIGYQRQDKSHPDVWRWSKSSLHLQRRPLSQEEVEPPQSTLYRFYTIPWNHQDGRIFIRAIDFRSNFLWTRSMINSCIDAYNVWPGCQLTAFISTFSISLSCGRRS